MSAKWSYFVIGSMGLVLAANGAACGPTTIDQGGGGNAGKGGEGGGSSSVSSTGSGGSAGGGVACDPMNLPVEGAPCATEGQTCGSGCEDPCAFCNIMRCVSGKWTNFEASPAPCLSCEDACPSVVAAMCAGGPPDQTSCVDGCKLNQMKCKIPFNQMLACVGTMPTFTCDAMTRPTVAGCEKEFDTLYACIMP